MVFLTLRQRLNSKFSGFSLIEMLVVLMILSITFSFAALAFHDWGSKRQVFAFTEQLSSYLKLLQERAVLEGNTFSVKLNPNDYQTYLFVNKKWQIFLPHPPLPKPKVPDQMTMQTFFHSKKTAESLLIIYPSGEISPFSLDLGTLRNSHLITLTGFSNGELILAKKNVS